MPGQAEVDQVIARGPLRPSISLCSTFEVTCPIDLRGVETDGVHFRRVKHDVIHCTVSEDF